MNAAPAQPVIEEQHRETTKFRWLVFAVFLLALVVRLAFFFGAQVDYPIRGDIIQYVNYAWNMIHHGTFSSAEPGVAQPSPDAFRGPGYPAFLAVWMWLAGAGQSWYTMAVMAQIVLGGLLAPLTIAWTRLWLPRGAALAAGFLAALWPHAIVLASTLLSETLFCALLLLFLCLAGLTKRFGGAHRGAAAGLVGGLAYLVNPVIAFFPPMVAALLFLRMQRRAAMAMVAVFLLVAGGWSARNAMHPGMQGAWDRAAANLVEGSWPLFHSALNARFEYKSASEMVAAVGAEERLMSRSPRAGFHSMFARFSDYPVDYARWYLLEKPYSLWGWWIGVGWGDVYFLETSNSPFDRQLVFRLIHEGYRYANPFFFGLAVFATLYAFARYRRDHSSEAFSLLMAAGFFWYVTGIHTLLQAEPRYSVAYRPMEVALAVTAFLKIWHSLTARRRHQPKK